MLVCNKTGGAGKSKFVKWLRISQKEIVLRKLPVSSVDRLTSAVFIISKTVKIDLYKIDLPRTISENISLPDLFHTLEEIKNGFIVDTMYGRYNERIFEAPQIVIFTNISFEKLIFVKIYVTRPFFSTRREKRIIRSLLVLYS